MFITSKRDSVGRIRYATIALLVFTFISQDMAWAADAAVSAALNEPVSRNRNVAVPKNISITKDVYRSPRGGGTIINIQDVHASLPAQESITVILDSLATNYDLDLIAIEGSSGYIDTSVLRTFPDERIRNETARYLARKGSMSAGEFFSVVSRKPIALYGIEDRSLYDENLKQFRAVYEINGIIKRDIERLLLVLKNLRGKIYSKELTELDSNSILLKDGKVSLSRRLEKIKDMADKAGAHHAKYPTLLKLTECLKMEKGINFERANRDRDTLMDILTKILPREGLEELVLKSVSFKSGEISKSEYYPYLRELARKYAVGRRAYMDLSRYCDYITLYESIDLLRIFEEAGSLEEEIRNGLFSNDEERELYNFSKCAIYIKGLFEISLTGRDYMSLNKLLETYGARFFESFIKEMSARYGIPPPGDDRYLDRIFENMPKAIEFYETAERRNSAMLENTLKLMNERGDRAAALITGGYHTKGLSEMLRRREMSYLVVLPKFDASKGERPYAAVLTRKRASREDILKGGQYGLAVGAYFEGDSPEAKERLFEAIEAAIAQSISERAGAEAAIREFNASAAPLTQQKRINREARKRRRAEQNKVKAVTTLWADNYKAYYDSGRWRNAAGFNPMKPEDFRRRLNSIAHILMDNRPVIPELTVDERLDAIEAEVAERSVEISIRSPQKYGSADLNRYIRRALSAKLRAKGVDYDSKLEKERAVNRILTRVIDGLKAAQAPAASPAPAEDDDIDKTPPAEAREGAERTRTRANSKGLLIFDMDGALYDSGVFREADEKAMASLLESKHISKELLEQKTSELGGMLAAAQLLRITAADINDYRARARDKVIAGFKKHPMPLVPGVRPMLELLRSEGYELTVLTNYRGDRAPEILRALGIEDMFAGIFVAQDNWGAPKPNPFAFGKILSATGFTADAAISIGDSKEDDIEPANYMGIRGIKVNGPDDLIKKLQGLIFEDMIRAFESGGPNEDEGTRAKKTKVIRDAYLLARRMHSRSLGKGYIFHALRVAAISARWGLDENVIAAAFMHGISESGARKLERTNIAAAALVKNFDRANRSVYLWPITGSHTAQNYAKKIVKLSGSLEVLLLVAANKLDSIRHAATSAEKERRFREIQHIYKPLLENCGAGAIATELVDEAFKAAHPEEYAETIEARRKILGDIGAAADPIAEEKRRLQYIGDRIADAVGREDVDAEIQLRPKGIYSSWEKVASSRRPEYTDMDLVEDIYGIKVITKEAEGAGLVTAAICDEPFMKDGDIRIKKIMEVDHKIRERDGYNSTHLNIKFIDRARGDREFDSEIMILTEQDESEYQFGSKHMKSLKLAPHWVYKLKDEEDMKGIKPRQRFDWECYSAYTPDPRSRFGDLLRSLEGREYVDVIVHETDASGAVITKMRVVELAGGAKSADLAATLHIDMSENSGFEEVEVGKYANGYVNPTFAAKRALAKTETLQTGQCVRVLTSQKPKYTAVPESPSAGHKVTRSQRFRKQIEIWKRTGDRPSVAGQEITIVRKDGKANRPSLPGGGNGSPHRALARPGLGGMPAGLMVTGALAEFSAPAALVLSAAAIIARDERPKPMPLGGFVSGENIAAILSVVEKDLPAIEAADLDNDLKAALIRAAREGGEAGRADFVRRMVARRKSEISAVYNREMDMAVKDAASEGKEMVIATTEKIAMNDPYTFDNMERAEADGIRNVFIYGEMLKTEDEARAYAAACGYKGGKESLKFISKDGLSRAELVDAIGKASLIRPEAYNMGIRMAEGELDNARAEGDSRGVFLEISERVVNGYKIYPVIGSYQTLLTLMARLQRGLSVSSAVIPDMRYNVERRTFIYFPKIIPIDYGREIEVYKNAMEYLRRAA